MKLSGYFPKHTEYKVLTKLYIFPSYVYPAPNNEGAILFRQIAARLKASRTVLSKRAPELATRKRHRRKFVFIIWSLGTV